MAEAPERNVGREGARWINQKPTPEEFAEWFEKNVVIEEGLDASRYVGGIVLIPAVEEPRVVTGWAQNGAPIVGKREQLVYVPYAKVETRVAYFWDLMELKTKEWIGVIEPADVRRPEGEGAIATLQKSLPDGFFVLPVPVGQAYTHFLCCTQQVAVYERETYGRVLAGEKARPIRQGRGTKMVPLVLGRREHYADQNSIMKAETGAIGRALGVAGIFTIPGSGVATAEDMLESMGGPQAAQTAAEEPQAATPPQTGAEKAENERETLLGTARGHIAKLREDFPEAYQEFGRWASNERGITDLTALDTAALKGVVRKAERLLQGVQEAHVARHGEPEPPAAETGEPA